MKNYDLRSSWLLIFLATVDFGVCVNQVVIQSSKQCPSGCTERGNCNSETGRCECPWGLTGPACEVDRLAACRQTPDDPGSCGTLWPKNCDCYAECHKLYCLKPSDPEFCTHELGMDLPKFRCFRQNDPAAPPTSLLPESDADKGAITWYQHFMPQGGAYDKSLQLPAEEWYKSQLSGGHVAHPLSDCPNRCSNGRGACFRWGWEKEPRCVCRKGYNGTNCEQADNHEACWFAPDCSGRGKCVSGFCHCQPGFFGVGCHRSTAYQPAPGLAPGEIPDARVPTKLKIYMYELPWDIAFAYEYNDGAFSRDAMYMAYELFQLYFLQDKVTRTENPYEANMFYIPMLLYFYIGNVRNPVPQTTNVLGYIKHHWPFYNRSGGRDHFYFMTGDRGTCNTPRWMQDQCIKLVHFGMQWQGLNWSDVPNKEYGCVQVKRDLVVPPVNRFTQILPTETEAYYKWIESTGGHDANRTLLFFFAGGLGTVPEYSGGARQAIRELLDSLKTKPPDVEFVEGRTERYRELLSTSKFCIAPYGFGWGLRLVQAVEFGCIPIIIQDHVYQAFEDFLPYEEFSVRLPLKDVPQMIEILRSYSEDQIAALRLGMARHFRAFYWDREYGGRAYEWTLAGLQRRLMHIQGEYFTRRRLLGRGAKRRDD